MQSDFAKGSSWFAILIIAVLCAGSFAIGYISASVEKADCDAERARAERYRQNYYWAMQQWPLNRD